MSGRSIAPRPTPHNEAAGPSAGPGLLGTTQAQSPISAASIPRKKVTSACRGCQKRRVKCDGNQPCATCVRTKTACSYTPDLDGRSIKRKYYEAQRDQDLLTDLLETIRYTKDEDVTRIISLIRSDASMADVKSCMAQQLKDIESAGRARSSEFEQLQDIITTSEIPARDQSRSSQRADFLEINRLTDTPLHRLSASPWTRVTEDDDLVSNLINMWLTWDKGWQDWVDEDLFLRDMQAGSLNSLFCSPFLVNSLLAWTCPYSDYRAARTANGAASLLMQQFTTEAKRLAEDEKNSALCMTTIQGLLILHGAMAVSGQNHNGYRYMLQGIALTQDLVSAWPSIQPHFDQQTADEISRCIDRTCWGVFMCTTQHFITVLRPQTMMKVPRRSRPKTGKRGTPVRIWTPYPLEEDPVPSYRDETFEFGCDLGVLEARLSRLLFDTEEQLPRHQLEDQLTQIHDVLQGYVRRRPSELIAVKGSCPTLFAQQVRIQVTILRIYMSLANSAEQESSSLQITAQARCIESALEVARLIKLYMQSWGSSRLGVIFAHPACVSTSVLMEEQNLALYSGPVTDLCVALRAMSRRWPIVMAMLRMIQLEARTQGWKLPVDTDKLFEEFESSSWKTRGIKRIFTQYPMAQATKATKPIRDDGHEINNMGDFLKQMDELEIEDSSADSDAE